MKGVEASVRMEVNAAMESVSVARASKANSVMKKKRVWEPSLSGSSSSQSCFSLPFLFSSEARKFKRRYKNAMARSLTTKMDDH